jgi:acyl carrier protein
VPQGRGTELVSAGYPAEGLELRIVNPETLEPCAPGRAGEIWISGPNVALGYWGKSEETEAVFGAHLKGDAGRRYLRTGDLGFLLEERLFVTGRLKDLIIVAGVNYYPQDIEAVVSDAHPFVRPGCGAAFGVDRQGSESLVVVTEVRDASREDLAEAAGAIRKDVATALGISPVMVAFISKQTLPKTSSGKVRRRATRDALLDGTLAPLAVFEWPAGMPQAEEMDPSEARVRRDELVKLDPTSRKEAVMRIVLSAVQGPPGSPAAPDLDAPIATLGIDSLRTVELLTQLEDELDVVLPMNDLLQRSSLRDLVAAIDAGLDEGRSKRS